jgi:hypothetical protein
MPSRRHPVTKPWVSRWWESQEEKAKKKEEQAEDKDMKGNEL